MHAYLEGDDCVLGGTGQEVHELLVAVERREAEEGDVQAQLGRQRVHKRALARARRPVQQIPAPVRNAHLLVPFLARQELPRVGDKLLALRHVSWHMLCSNGETAENVFRISRLSIAVCIVLATSN
jgi:hypothetical protein